MMKDSRPYWKVVVSLAFALLATAAVLLIGYYGIILFAPFVIGWIVAGIANPLTKWLEKKLKIKRKIGSALVIVFVLALVIGILYLVIYMLVVETGKLVRDFPSMYQDVLKGFEQIKEAWEKVSTKLPSGLENLMSSLGTAISGATGTFISKISEPTVDAAGRLAKSVPSVLIGGIVMLLSAYFFVADREEIYAWAKKVTPKAVYERINMVIYNLKHAVGGYFKAQFQIMGVVFGVVLVGLLIGQVRYAVIIALLIAFLDFFPFLGTAITMVPWAIYELLTEDYVRAIIIFVTYVVSQVVRQLIQPKLVGDCVGMRPMPTLVFIYLGYKVGGIFGMVLAVPAGWILINMYRAGAFDYILDDVKILVRGIASLRKK